jgi:hypothetical protein
MSVSKGNKRNYVRCPGCGRQPVAVKRGRLVSHLSPGGVRCYWTGQLATVVENLRALREAK